MSHADGKTSNRRDHGFMASVRAWIIASIDLSPYILGTVEAKSSAMATAWLGASARVDGLAPGMTWLDGGIGQLLLPARAWHDVALLTLVSEGGVWVSRGSSGHGQDRAGEERVR